MTSFCHDQYEHPLLWCDDKRRAVERQDAQQSLQLVKQRREIEKLKAINERNEVGYLFFISIRLLTARKNFFV